MDDAKRKQAQVSALRMLAAAPKSSQDLKRKLTERGFDEESVEAALSSLEKQGLLNDRAFAENLISRYTHAQPSGARRIAFELKRRGVPAKLREEMMENFRPEQERERAQEIAEVRWQRLERIPWEKRKKRL